jgi:hypothetical protein
VLYYTPFTDARTPGFRPRASAAGPLGFSHAPVVVVASAEHSVRAAWRTGVMAELSPYEVERERTIARNREMLASLNIPTPVNDRVRPPPSQTPLHHHVLFAGTSVVFSRFRWRLVARMERRPPRETVALA